MRKYLKSFILAALVVCMTACLGIFAAACNETPDEKSELTIKVVLPDDANTPVKDAEVSICLNEAPYVCLDPVVKTDENGVAKLSYEGFEDKTKFFIKVHNVPEGYVYADANGNVYKDTEGLEIDTAVDGKEITIPLTVDTVVALNAPHLAFANNTYKFTATKAADYLFTVSKFHSGWTLKNQTQAYGNATLAVAANETVELKVNEDCKVLVTEKTNVGTSDNPVVLTLGEAKAFDMTVFTQSDMRGNASLSWILDSDDGAYYLKFTSAEAGKYKLTLTSSFADDEVDFDLAPVDSSVGVPDMPINNTYGDIKANTEYSLILSNQFADYTGLNDGDVVNYTLKVEYVPEGTTEALIVNLNGNTFECVEEGAEAGQIVYAETYTCKFTGEAGKTYTVSVTDAEFATLNGACPAFPVDLTAGTDGTVTFTVKYDGWDESFTITVVEKVVA